MSEFSWNSRKHFRVQFDTQAAFRVNRFSKKELRLKEKTISTHLLDLSAGGCALESPHFAPTGIKLNVFLDRNQLLPPAETPKKKNIIRIVGVIRTSRQLPNHKYRFGIQFERISAADVQIIRNFVELHERREEKRISFPS